MILEYCGSEDKLASRCVSTSSWASTLAELDELDVLGELYIFDKMGHLIKLGDLCELDKFGEFY